MSKHSIGAYMELVREVGTSFEAVLASGKTTSQDQSNDESATFSGKIAELERHKTSLMQELCQSESRVDRAKKEIEGLKTTILALEKQDAQKTQLINQYRNITVKSLEEANSAFQKYRLSAVTSKQNRGWNGVLDIAHNDGQEDEEWMSLD